MQPGEWIHHNQHLLLLPEKAVYWKEKNWLLIADLHIGKSSHFRKSGIHVPSQVSRRNFETLAYLFEKYQPHSVIFLGDLFHSYRNKENDELGEVLRQFKEVRFVLVKGNHDLMKADYYEKMGLIAVDNLLEEPFYFTHHPEDSAFYNLCGHIHPAVSLRGRGRQSLELPCYHFGSKRGILPAFGQFTGVYPLPFTGEDQVFVCAGEAVVEVTAENH